MCLRCIHQSNNHFELENIHGAACHPPFNTSSFCCHSIHVMNTHKHVCVYVRQMTPMHIKSAMCDPCVLYHNIVNCLI